MNHDDVMKMWYPVRCAYCSTIYDTSMVTVTGRYSDCSMWNTPCCGRQVDDRGETGWKTKKDYYVIDKEGYRDIHFETFERWYNANK